MLHIIRILLFIKDNELTSWKKDRLRQRETAKCDNPPTDWNRYSGVPVRYPLRGSDMFPREWFRFIDRHENAIGDASVFFDCHGAEKHEKLYIFPNGISGGLDITTNPQVVVNDRLQGKPELRWFPLPLTDLFLPDNPTERTIIVIQHPDKFCKTVCSGRRNTDTDIFGAADKTPVIRLSGQKHLFLTGGSNNWCEDHFTGEGDSFSLESFFHFIENDPIWISEVEACQTS